MTAQKKGESKDTYFMFEELDALSRGAHSFS
jgi:hypothetical protein